ncbi:MAG TPA: hypothetical protein VK892_09825 [Pyrinomonadaceae bacterium]|nr:hypothetical protein [Pyrinomonadaceae bacterium]
MKKTFLKTIGTAGLAILMLATFAQLSVSAKDKSYGESSTQTRGNSFGQSNDKRGLEGSWNSLVTIRNCETGAELFTFPAMQTYMFGGTMQDSSADSRRSSGHGVWSHQSGQRYSAAFQYFSFNADGTFAGTVKVRMQHTLNRTDDSFTTNATIEIFSPDGTLVTTGCATANSTRFE